LHKVSKTTQTDSKEDDEKEPRQNKTEIKHVEHSDCPSHNWELHPQVTLHQSRRERKRDGEGERVKIIHLKPILLKLITELNGLTSSGTSKLQAGKKTLFLSWITKLLFYAHKKINSWLNLTFYPQRKVVIPIKKSGSNAATVRDHFHLFRLSRGKVYSFTGLQTVLGQDN